MNIMNILFVYIDGVLHNHRYIDSTLESFILLLFLTLIIFISIDLQLRKKSLLLIL